MSHTPTPWKHVVTKDGWDGVKAADGTAICDLNYNNPENASFIARAVNAHDELIGALAPFVDAFAKADDPGVSDLDNEQPFSLHVPLGAWRKARAAYRARVA